MAFGLVLISIAAGLYIWTPKKENVNTISAIIAAIGGSVCASGIVGNIIEATKKTSKFLLDSGIEFIGDRASFISWYGSWDKWIADTPFDAEIMICGKKNSKWITDSWYALEEKIKDGVPVTFIFSGDPQAKNQESPTDHFKNMKKSNPEFTKAIEKYGEKKLLKCYQFETSSEVEDGGFYWNGNHFILKLYLPEMVNIECPLFVFRLRWVRRKFHWEDFATEHMFGLVENQAQMKLARSLDKILKSDKLSILSD